MIVTVMLVNAQEEEDLLTIERRREYIRLFLVHIQRLRLFLNLEIHIE